jgi:hypothetical protein
MDQGPGLLEGVQPVKGPLFLPPDLAMASDVKLVDSSMVTAGGVITANRPHFDRNSRRF